MRVLTVVWFILLALIQKISVSPVGFKLDEGPLTAYEGSCIEIKCTVISNIKYDNVYWFWMKNAIWQNEDYNGTIIFSTNTKARPISSDYADRARYTGSLRWPDYHRRHHYCSVLICNLTKKDSGDYSVRYVNQLSDKWSTDPAVKLTVTENPCPITFKEPPVVNESDSITLTCSTLRSCPSNLQIEDLPQMSSPLQQNDDKNKRATVRFTAKWEDDGKMFSCQTQDNKDKYLIQNISMTVQYAPKDVMAEPKNSRIKEGDAVTFTCSAKGRPTPTFSWFKNEKILVSKDQQIWVINSVKDSDSGEYHCEAHNKLGTTQSDQISVNVTYAPEVEVKSDLSTTEVEEGREMSLRCNVKRSNPPPFVYTWYKNQVLIHQERRETYSVRSIRPEESGNYSCVAANSVGSGYSPDPVQINVQYRPRMARINQGKEEIQVKVDRDFILTCNAEANPRSYRYSWYRYNDEQQTEALKWNPEENSLLLKSIQRGHEPCYTCNATNTIGTGDNSNRACLKVLYPPTNLMLSVDTLVVEGQLITIICTVESFPPSSITLKMTPTLNSKSSEKMVKTTNNNNTLHHKFNATSAHAGLYTCRATNSEGSSGSQSKKLVVKYSPKDVKVQAGPGLIVRENTRLTLTCSTHSNPELTSVTWTKVTDEKKEIIHTSMKNTPFIRNSVAPSDRGKYSCVVSNEIGNGSSKPVEVKVEYAPKHASITRVAEHQQPDGTKTVTLMCSSESYPEIEKYQWYKRIETGEGHLSVFSRQNYTVSSKNPGDYYCTARNAIGQKMSEPYRPFDDGALMRAFKIVFLCVIVLMFLIFLIVFLYKRKRNKSVHQGTANTLTHMSFLGWWNDTRGRNLMNEAVLAEPSRSRDDLLPDQPCGPKAQRRGQPHSDITPPSNINTVYSTVNLPGGKQGPSAQKPARQQGGRTEDDSLNYASLHFGKEQKSKPAKTEESSVYAVVSKPPKKNENEILGDYENVVNLPNPQSSDTDTSEDELELNYARVSFKAKPGCKSADKDSSSETSSETSSDSSTSDEEQTQYSQVKI